MKRIYLFLFLSIFLFSTQILAYNFDLTATWKDPVDDDKDGYPHQRTCAMKISESHGSHTIVIQLSYRKSGSTRWIFHSNTSMYFGGIGYLNYPIISGSPFPALIHGLYEWQVEIIENSTSSYSVFYLDAIAFETIDEDKVIAPVADFKADLLTGSAPFTVHFSDQSTGDISNRSWIFGDGQASSDINPTHLFEKPGRYTVQLDVSGPGGSNSKILKDYIIVKGPALIENVTFKQRTDGSLMVDIYYDLSDADGDVQEIKLYASEDDRKNWNLPCSSLSGDVGSLIQPGFKRHIVWDFFIDNPRVSGDGYRVRIMADDKYFLNLEPAARILESTKGSTAIFSLASNSTWNVTDNADWLIVSPTSGTGNGTINVTAISANLSTTPRNATITLSGMGGTKNVLVTQSGAPSFVKFKSDSISVLWESNSYSRVIVESNISWTPSTDASWLRLSTGYYVDGYQCFDVNSTEPNHSRSSRSAIVKVVSVDGLISTVIVVQYGEPEMGTMADIDGNVYKTVKIGNQWWMAENLKTTKYLNGEKIKRYPVDTWVWVSRNPACYNYYWPSDRNAYGMLYNWYAVNDSRCLAPEGWHVPSDEEWKQLEMALGMSKNQTDSEDWRGVNVGTKLKTKEMCLIGTYGFNMSGFNAQPGGHLNLEEQEKNLLITGNFWTATGTLTYGKGTAWKRSLDLHETQVFRGQSLRDYGFSVRCVRDN